MRKSVTGDLLFAAFCILFGAIYEVFSFGVFSFCMIYAFVFPFSVGMFLLISCFRGRNYEGLFLTLINASAATAAVGSLAAGVVEIYGSENRLLIVYPIAAGILFAAAVTVSIVNRVRRRVSKEENVQPVQ